MQLKIYNNLDLVPESWIRSRGAVPNGVGADWYVFNPTLVRLADAFVMTYRVVDEVQKTRRIASCKLTDDLSIVTGSVTPLSDLIEFEGAARFSHRTLTWHADPRYFKLGDDLYVFWNDGSLKPKNHQFLMKIGSDGLKPAGKARLVCKVPHESRIEKNWQFFDTLQNVYAIYENRPLHLLSVDLSGNDLVICSEAAKVDWVTSYEEKFGQIRGGAQPVRYQDGFLVLAHSSHKNSQGKLVYHPCFYRFEIQPSFRVTHTPKYPFLISVPDLERPRMPRLNKKTASVIYPCGLVIDGDHAIISLGINDESCAVGRFRMEDIMNSMEAVDASVRYKAALSTTTRPHQDAETVMECDDRKIPLFWWNAIGKRFDSERNFSTGNVGDIASKVLIELLSGVGCRQPRKNERKLLSIGSIIQNASDGDVVWGSGIKGPAVAFKNPVRDLAVYAVRGPLTVDFLRRQGIDLQHLKELFDPGCLFAYLYAKQINSSVSNNRKSKICIIPHYKDHLILQQKHPEFSDSFLSVDAMPQDFIKGMLGAELVISSSLHGIIFAEALGIPALWLAPVNGEDELKYYDYYYGTNRYNVKRFTSIGAALAAEPMDLPRFRFDDYLDSFPKEVVLDLCATKPSKPLPSRVLLDEEPYCYATQKNLPATHNCQVLAADEKLTSDEICRPVSMQITSAIIALRSGRFNEGVKSLYHAATNPQVLTNESLRLVIQRTARLYLGCSNFEEVFRKSCKTSPDVW